ncbi:hypothetical protein HELRODRAFT_168389 [Helobdella robusta]|uniref:Uncharacterized protein n=1 Tax=Helobdella robusta TaxID=6412 RepID=T1F0J0_HELRO|nr:hypothetical protein HELRODRAFT_168389 [Helobdella robusta]ESO09406.1 hypothetical protein HELRODRAFT_168389 [Helobdella robusta]
MARVCQGSVSLLHSYSEIDLNCFAFQEIEKERKTDDRSDDVDDDVNNSDDNIDDDNYYDYNDVDHDGAGGDSNDPDDDFVFMKVPLSDRTCNSKRKHVVKVSYNQLLQVFVLQPSQLQQEQQEVRQKNFFKRQNEQRYRRQNQHLKKHRHQKDYSSSSYNMKRDSKKSNSTSNYLPLPNNLRGINIITNSKNNMKRVQADKNHENIMPVNDVNEPGSYEGDDEFISKNYKHRVNDLLVKHEALFIGVFTQAHQLPLHHPQEETTATSISANHLDKRNSKRKNNDDDDNDEENNYEDVVDEGESEDDDENDEDAHIGKAGDAPINHRSNDLTGHFTTYTDYNNDDNPGTSHSNKTSFKNIRHAYRPRNTAIAIISMAQMNQFFSSSIQRCFKGEGSTGPDHYVHPNACFNTMKHANTRSGQNINTHFKQTSAQSDSTTTAQSSSELYHNWMKINNSLTDCGENC